MTYLEKGVSALIVIILIAITLSVGGCGGSDPKVKIRRACEGPPKSEKIDEAGIIYRYTTLICKNGTKIEIQEEK